MDVPSPAYSTPSYVGEHGASVVAAALRRVARINNIPIAAHEWLHGSIASRMHHLRDLASGGAQRTYGFDAYMRRLYWALIVILAAVGTSFGVGVAMGKIQVI